MKPNQTTLDRWEIVARRKPTPSEIRRGYGATHYKNMSMSHWLKPDGTLKKWTVCPFDGLRYYR